MKKYLLILSVLIGCSIAFASIDASYECDKKSCVEGSMVHWTVPVSNNINKTITVEYIRLVNENALSIAYYDAERNKTLNPDESYVYKFDTLITAPPSGYTWYYKPCMRVLIEGAAESEFVCKDAVKSFTVLPKEKTGCLTDSDCAINEFCEDYTLKCAKLECESGNVVKDHGCVAENSIMPDRTKIIILAVMAVVIIAIAAAVFMPKKEGSDKEESWYEESKPKKNKRNKKKGRKRRK
jgi:hypothetical protein